LANPVPFTIPRAIKWTTVNERAWDPAIASTRRF
jgi:hypothetical protein